MSYTQLYDPVTPQEALSGPNIAFRGLRKISTAEQFRLRNSLRDRTVEYTTWVWGFTKFAKSFYSNREFRSLNCSAVLIFRNPRKAMFGPESASWGVTGSYS